VSRSTIAAAASLLSSVTATTRHPGTWDRLRINPRCRLPAPIRPIRTSSCGSKGTEAIVGWVWAGAGDWVLITVFRVGAGRARRDVERTRPIMVGDDVPMGVLRFLRRVRTMGRGRGNAVASGGGSR